MRKGRRGFYDVLLATFAATGSFLFGYDSGVMTDVIASPHFLSYFHTHPTSPLIGAINSTFAGGAVLGALTGGLTMDRCGRKTTIQLGAGVAVVGGVLQAAAANLAMLLVGRIVSGWAVGLMSMAIPVYQAECAHPQIRGLIVGLTQQMIGVGFVVSTWIGFGCHHIRGGPAAMQWRFPLAFQVLPAMVLLVGFVWLPESPRWLIERGEDAQGMAVLHKLHAGGRTRNVSDDSKGDESDGDTWVRAEYNEIRATLSAERAATGGAGAAWRLMFVVPEWRKRLLHGTLVQVFTQMTGINVINAYQTLLYNSLGLTGSRAVLVAGIYNCVGPLTNLLFIVFALDRVGRRRPLLFGAATISLALICEAALNATDTGDGNHAARSGAAVGIIFLVSVLFSVSFGPIAWVYVGEIMPMPIRGKGVAFATGVGNWLVSTIFAQVSPIALGAIGWRYYFVFVGFNVLVTMPTIWFFFKETNRLSLEEIDLLFGERALGTLPRVVGEKDVEEAVRRESVVRAQSTEIRRLSVSFKTERGG